MENNDWSGDFKGLFNSALGKELIRSLTEDLHANKIKEAERSEDPNKAFGLLKEASGVMLAMEHMMFLSAMVMDEEKRV